MEDNKNVLHLIALADNEETASSLLNSALPGVSTSDNQEWTLKEGDFTVKCYLKCPGADISRRSAEQFVDIVLGTASDNSSNAVEEIVNYLASRGDSPLVHYVSDNGSDKAESSGVLVIKASDVKNLITEHIAKVKSFNDDVFSKNCNDNKEISSENFTQFFESAGLDSSVADKVSSLNDSISYGYARKLYFISSKNSTVFKYLAALHHKANSFIEIAEKFISSYISNVNTTNSSNDLVGDVKVVPFSSTTNENTSNLNTTNNKVNSNEAEGIGLSVKFLLGEDYKKKNNLLPLVIRDNLATLSVEISAKSSEGVDSVYETINGALQMASQMGLIEKIADLGATLTLRKETNSVFIDLTAGKILGDFLVNKLNRLNLDVFKTGISEYLSIKTGLDASDIYKNFSVDNIIDKVCKTTVIGSGKILNVRTLLNLFKTFQANYKPSEGQLNSYSFKKNTKALNLIYFGLKALSCFEKSNLDIVYSSENLKETVKSGLELGSGEDYESFSSNLSEKARDTIEGLLGMLESFKGMATMFGEGASLINLDHISIDLIAPGVQFNANLSIALVGLSAFLQENIFS